MFSDPMNISVGCYVSSVGVCLFRGFVSVCSLRRGWTPVLAWWRSTLQWRLRLLCLTPMCTSATSKSSPLTRSTNTRWHADIPASIHTISVCYFSVTYCRVGRSCANELTYTSIQERKGPCPLCVALCKHILYTWYSIRLLVPYASEVGTTFDVLSYSNVNCCSYIPGIVMPPMTCLRALFQRFVLFLFVQSSYVLVGWW